MNTAIRFSTLLATSLALLSTAVMADQPANSRTARERVSFNTAVSSEQRPADSQTRTATQPAAKQAQAGKPLRGHQG